MTTYLATVAQPSRYINLPQHSSSQQTLYQPTGMPSKNSHSLLWRISFTGQCEIKHLAYKMSKFPETVNLDTPEKVEEILAFIYLFSWF